MGCIWYLPLYAIEKTYLFSTLFPLFLLMFVLTALRR